MLRLAVREPASPAAKRTGPTLTASSTQVIRQIRPQFAGSLTANVPTFGPKPVSPDDRAYSGRLSRLERIAD
jgi:hypothetical protein